MATKFSDFLKEQLKDKELAKEYYALDAEFSDIKEARKTEDKIGGTYYTTTDYSIFKFMDGNRPHEDDNPTYRKRVGKIMESIRSVGYITSPLVVNEKREIADGQARFGALKELGLPIDYIIKDGIGIKECIAMNLKQSNWTQADFIYSYAKQGNQNYVIAWELMRKYLWMDTRAIFFGLHNYSKSSAITKGNFVVAPDKVADIEDVLTWVCTFEKVTKELQRNGKIHGKRELQQALIFLYRHKEVSNSRVYEIITTRWPDMIPMTNTRGCLASIEKAYNKGLEKRNRVYMETDYLKVCGR